MSHRVKKENLWTKNFTCITGGTILSAIGGEAMNLPISLLVFQETKSTFLAALIMVCGMLPDIILPIIIAPFIDKGNKKAWIVGLDCLLGILYLVVGLWVKVHSFSYVLYVVLTLVIGTISVFYHLAYSAWYPDLIPVGMEQKGYAVSATLYPMVIIVMSPVAAFIYGRVVMGNIFIMVSILTFLSVIMEAQIKSSFKKLEEVYTLCQYVQDIKYGFSYIRKEKGIRNIYTYMSITSGASQGVNVITQAYYQISPWLSVTMLGFLKSAEMIGRFFSGIVQYKKTIPVKKRYEFTKGVYLTYDLMDTFLLFMPYPLMLANRFICGGLGTSSATIRETAVQCYLPPEIRARVNAIFSVLMAIGGVGFQLVAGVLGQVMPYKYAAMILGLTTLTCMFLLIVIPARSNRPIYEATRQENDQYCK